MNDIQKFQSELAELIDKYNYIQVGNIVANLEIAKIILIHNSEHGFLERKE